ncbi:hypothetical protein GPECTOR_25g447 [Gonium pectorale]|uniref:Uncharacterized protein n=1 Tax=Gonium pectorale TaxID=33097 RepID=A0A150GG99_GONPE|nr:hypothetical protein GPECTOR_25g447 [Gonium pectorale]|eukprot:KXZ48862.1 hypothetical protein GPECTOR_25g447 [Gonium pectorale]
MKEHRRGVLQVLRPRHAPLFTLLGKTSSRDVDKFAAIQEAGFSLCERYGVQTLEGDHDVVICRVSNFENLTDDPSDVLYTSALRAAGYL